ncbi:MAG: hypothetical protein MJY92_01270 [Bacteroidales bacterium]|nr:hypothetical protein [Bacteroidales bacterium]
MNYPARLYNPENARWNSPDPMAEKYYYLSPYAFCNNNPVIFVDPDGKVIRKLYPDKIVISAIIKTNESLVSEMMKSHKGNTDYLGLFLCVAEPVVF